MAHPELDVLWTLASRDVASVEVKAHVEACERCQAKLEECRATQRLLPPVTPLPPVPPLPDEAWARLDERLLARATEVLSASPAPARRPPFRAAWLVPLAVAAAAVLLWVWGPKAPAPAPLAERPSAPASPQEGATEVVLVERTPGRSGGVGTPRRLRAGERVETVAQRSAELRFADGAVATLHEATAVTLRVLSARESAFALEQGSVTVAAPHRPERVVRIQAGAFEIRNVGTRFDVERAGAAVEVRVAEGTVEVRGGDAAPVRLTAGEARRFTETGGEPVPAETATVAPPAERPVRREHRSERPRPEPPSPSASTPAPVTDPTPPLTQAEAPPPRTAPPEGSPDAGAPASAAPSTVPERGGVRGALDKLRSKIKPGFAPLNSSEREQRARDVERLADEGSCGIAVTRADAWLAEYAPPERLVGREAQLRRTVLQTKARCLDRLGQPEEARRVRAEADALER